MAEYHDAEWARCNDAVVDAPDGYDGWERLVRVTESLEGGVSRQSTPQHVAVVRSVYDRFLGRFPLFFGYWKKYADLEFLLAGAAAAEHVYERGVAACPMSVDLWTQYAAFKMDTSHDPEEIRDLFERGAAKVGGDFLAHPFWDKYLEYEDRLESPDRAFAILDRVVHIPMHQYARYFERYATLSQSRPLSTLLPADVLASFRRELLQEPVDAVKGGGREVKVERGELEVEREMRVRVHHLQLEAFNRTRTAVTRRWPFESEIRRPYFHVTELPYPEVVNWRRYLDFEELEGEASAVRTLYERCVHACALYDEFWLRYARWTAAGNGGGGGGGGEDEVRNVYQRACAAVPLARPYVRYAYARWEESRGNADVARDIYAAIMLPLPGLAEATVVWANLERRQGGVDAALAFYEARLKRQEYDVYGRAILIAETAKLHHMGKADTARAREVYRENSTICADSRYFWINYLRFETQLPDNLENARQAYASLSEVARLPPDTLRALSREYLCYLDACAPDLAEFAKLDVEVEGPYSVRVAHHQRQAGEDGRVDKLQRDNLSMNGHPGVRVHGTLENGEAAYERERQLQA